MRVLHVNLGPDGLGHYGCEYGPALASVPGVEALTLLRADLLASPVCWRAARDQKVRAVEVEGRGLLSVIGEVATVARRFKPDVVHDTAGSAMPRGALVTSALALLSKVVVTEHDPSPHMEMGEAMIPRMARRLVRHSASLVVVHGAHSRRLALAAGYRADQVVVMRHGSYRLFDLNRGGHAASDTGRVLFFGALRPNKGVELLPALCDAMRTRIPSARLIVAGSPKLSPELMKSDWPARLGRVLEALHARPNCEVHAHFIADEEVEGFFRRAGIVLLPYLEGTQSGVASIAQAFGACVLATRVGDIPEVVVNGETGVVCEPNLASIRDALIELLAEPARAKRLGAAAREQSRNEGDWRAIAARHVSDVYPLAMR